MLAYVKPGSGITPALRPNCPGTHCPFCWARADSTPPKKMQIKTNVSSLIRNRILVLLAFLRSEFRDTSGGQAMNGGGRLSLGSRVHWFLINGDLYRFRCGL